MSDTTLLPNTIQSVNPYNSKVLQKYEMDAYERVEASRSA